jgi:hypothetical protein
METEKRQRVLPLRKTAQSWWVLTVPHTAVPGYPVEELRKILDDDAFETEVLINWERARGKVVFPQWNRALHVSVDDLEINPNETIYCGFDPAYTGTPAFVPTQINAMGQWQIFPAVCPPPNQTVGPYEFGERVASYLQREFAMPHGLELDDLKLVFIGDPWGNARVPRPGQAKREAASFYEILKKGIDVVVGQDQDGNPVYEHRPGWGWKVIPGAVNITARLEAVRSRLSTLLPGGYPAMVVDHRAESFIAAMGGAYHYKDYGDGTYGRDPEKNWHANIVDAAAYIATRLYAKHKPTKERDEDDDDTPRHEFRSMASGRYD